MESASNYLPPVPITVLTGFLGSGKTTLLTRLIRQPAMARTVVIVNEFGEVGLDHHLVAEASGNTVLLDSGCVCCTMLSDLSATLRDLHRRRMVGEIPDFDRVVIETTGLADPGPILHTLMTDRVILGYFKLDGVVTTVDAVHGLGQLNRNTESMTQVAVADRIVVTKTDLASSASLSLLKSRLREMNPAASIQESDSSEVTGLLMFESANYSLDPEHLDVDRWLKAEAYDHRDNHAHHPDHRHDDDDNISSRHHDAIDSFCLTSEKPVRWGALVGFLDALTQLRGADLLRVKGLVDVEESDLPVVIQGVEHLFHPPSQLQSWPDSDRRSRVVFITRNLTREPIEDLFRICVAAVEAKEAPL
ncbi:CobW family GTP-binding protein [Novosphingobium album (ex Liu et al. 2023)]|uniref:GTP-binding protein n=1 Tax=Novosphingobium album (ex Liu et al. 2023) TaxID=3031130 RepID=A0ABT5WTI6_9SPHN|nr:GTP-binding protein [Novosphingobium album (ex Liu et al. 2023)]MDE8653204.1 GTP-binding protein [Novosphingobium album (ex Liu et al. 2023)]